MSNFAVGEVLEFDLQRKVVAHMTSASWRNAPHVSFIYEPDITDFYAVFRTIAAERLARADQPRKISFNTILLKALVEGLLAAPKLNSLIEFDAATGSGRLQMCPDINISLPWFTPDGRTITPVIAHAEAMSLDAMADAIAKLARKIDQTNIDEMLLDAIAAKTADDIKKFHLGTIWRVLNLAIRGRKTPRLRGEERKRYYRLSEDVRLSRKDIMNGTVTISNIGSLYREQRGYLGLLELVPPQVLAIGVGAVQDKPGLFVDQAKGQQIGIRKFIPICLVFDHRAFDFFALVPLLKRLDTIFAGPEEAFGW
ncbi:MAG: 2-oxo acid dehydrogenase subunit E2 [Rhodopseudomonas sp.]|uniref:2-oxo acid dehydrogenase subunit E2 n=1 Tax=Rhodopseudomonas sp. TaxID=1078 RepID=UPI0017A4545B|nr:2-oxo acid dehydrogenase subunit E2 [Rhodopseudomonas sp.]NVN87743.1 2-oxo acid dehydrogenase subunit E2 [Rhodopseudomonas sp.]